MINFSKFGENFTSFRHSTKVNTLPPYFTRKFLKVSEYYSLHSRPGYNLFNFEKGYHQGFATL